MFIYTLLVVFDSRGFQGVRGDIKIVGMDEEKRGEELGVRY